MRRIGAMVALTAGGAAGVAAMAAARRARQRPAAADRWHSTTINREPEAVGSSPRPLHDQGETVRVRPAPGGGGTQVAARRVQAGPRREKEDGCVSTIFEP